MFSDHESWFTVILLHFFYFSSCNGNFLYLISLKYFSFSPVQHTLMGPLGGLFLPFLILHSGRPSDLCIQQLQINTRLRFKEISGCICWNCSCIFLKQCLSNCMKTKTWNNWFYLFRLHNADYYMQEAKKLKHKADALVSCFIGFISFFLLWSRMLTKIAILSVI